jgi:glycosyltransferase involved in cell wall biosynthesis
VTSPVQTFPDPATYRAQLVAEGARQPLPFVPARPEGLLAALPAPPAGRTGWPWTVQSAPWTDDAASGCAPCSIVVPSFGQAAFVEETLRSILLQNHPRLELIVIDGGSGPDVRTILERYRPWLSHLRIAPDRGQAHAINLGFSLARAEGLRAFMNTDDFYLPDAFAAVEAARRRTGATLVHGDQLVWEPAERRLRIESLVPPWPRFVKFPGLLASHATFWCASIHQPVWEEHHCAIDYELWIRLVPGSRSAYVPRPLGLVRHYETTKTASPAFQAKWAEDADRNGRAHPHLYRPRPWLDLEHRLVHGWLRRVRRRRLERELAAARAACGWQEPAT